MSDPAVGLLEACEDERLLGVELFPRQRDVLEAIERNRLNIVACGRRSGKTFLGAVAAVWDACLRPDLARHVRRGEKRYAACVAVNVAQARLFVSFARSIVEASPLLSQLVLS